MNCELTYEDHAAIQTNSLSYEGMRMYQSPQIEARLLGQAAQVRGLGEPATAVAAPALGNAIFAATGQRLRELPYSKTVAFA